VALPIDLSNYAALGWPHLAGHAFDHRTFSVAVGAEQHDGFTVAGGQRHV
jgi:hypothetical protein